MTGHLEYYEMSSFYNSAKNINEYIIYYKFLLVFLFFVSHRNYEFQYSGDHFVLYDDFKETRV